MTKNSDEGIYVPGNPLERAALAIEEKLRAAGRPVTVKEPSGSEEFVVTFPGFHKSATRVQSAHDHGPIEFEEAVKHMVSDKKVIKAIKKEFGKDAQEMLGSVEAGKIPNELWDFLDDLLINSDTVKSFLSEGSYGDFPIFIQGIGGVYFYDAQDFDRVGYFLSIEDAESAIRMNWDDVREDD